MGRNTPPPPDDDDDVSEDGYDPGDDVYNREGEDFLGDLWLEGQ